MLFAFPNYVKCQTHTQPCEYRHQALAPPGTLRYISGWHQFLFGDGAPPCGLIIPSKASQRPAQRFFMHIGGGKYFKPVIFEPM